jgi:hypothetical protein
LTAALSLLLALSTGHAIYSRDFHVGIRLAMLGAGDEVGIGLTVQVTGRAFSL